MSTTRPDFDGRVGGNGAAGSACAEAKAAVALTRGVPEYYYHGLLNATSPGWYFNFYLRGRY